MGIYELSTKTLAAIEHGALAAAIDAKIKDAVADMRDRPQITGKRKVTLTIEMAPKYIDQAGMLEDVTTSMRVNLRLPELNTREYVMAARGGKLAFNDLAPQNPHQQTLELDEPAEAE